MDNQEDKASLEGKGWDILAGGKDHASELHRRVWLFFGQRPQPVR
jgi:hypothetical protein